MLTVKQVGARLGVVRGREQPFGVTTVLKYINRGELKATRLESGMFVIQEADLQVFIETVFLSKNHVGGRPRLHPKVEKPPGHGNAGKKYRPRRQKGADAAE